jgi:hypothetical protein
MAVAQAELPRAGYGSEQWFSQVFNFDNEREKVLGAIDRFGEEVGVPAALEWMRRQSRTLLTEFGVGERALIVQPLTRFVMRKEGDGWGVYAYKLNEFGEQLEDYQDFDKQPKAIGEGLEKAFSLLAEAEVGEAAVIVSPTELYADYESKGNVLNPLVVTNRNNGEVEIASWFLFVDKNLTDEERAFLLNIHEQDLIDTKCVNAKVFDWGDSCWTSLDEEGSEEVGGLSFVERLVKTPAKFGFPAEIEELRQLPKNSTKPEDFYKVYKVMTPYLIRLDDLFRQKFGKYLLEFEETGEQNLRERVENLIRDNVQGLLGLLLRNDKRGLLRILWEMLSFGQRRWAEESDRDADSYMYALEAGVIQVAGFHPTTGESTDAYKDSLTGDWLDGDQCGEGENSKECPKCNRSYAGNECSYCKKGSE